MSYKKITLTIFNFIIIYYMRFSNYVYKIQINKQRD